MPADDNKSMKNYPAFKELTEFQVQSDDGGLSSFLNMGIRECSGSLVESLTRDQRAMGSSLTGVTALCP